MEMRNLERRTGDEGALGWHPQVQQQRGQQVRAVYREGVKNGGGNPLIEALPGIYDDDSIIQYLGMGRKVTDKDRQGAPEIRMQNLYEALLQFFEPLQPHIDLEHRLSRLIRAGYLARNPIVVKHAGDSRERLQAFVAGRQLAPGLQTSALGFSIIGMPGMGKTSAVLAILQALYPQVIVHSAYRNKPFTLKQLVWLKLECPSDGSIKGLCQNFFAAVDDLLGTPYRRRYGRGTVDELVPNIARVASNHCLGTLVIDEIQHLSQAKSGGAARMLNFFVQLVNTIGVPVVTVGTYQAMRILGTEFRQVRRAGGQGEFIWDCWERNSREWRLLTDGLWQYQFVRHPVPLTDSLRDALHDVTQGITDYAIKVFMLAQDRAIERGDEQITSNLFRSVANDWLRQAQPILEAIRAGNKHLLAQIGDAAPIDMDRYLLKRNNDVTLVGRIVSEPEVRVLVAGAVPGDPQQVELPLTSRQREGQRDRSKSGKTHSRSERKGAQRKKTRSREQTQKRRAA